MPRTPLAEPHPGLSPLLGVVAVLDGRGAAVLDVTSGERQWVAALMAAVPGDSAERADWRALAHLDASGVGWRPGLGAVDGLTAQCPGTLRTHLAAAPTGGGLLGLRDALATLAGRSATGAAPTCGYRFGLEGCRHVTVDPSPVVRAAALDAARGARREDLLVCLDGALADLALRLAVRLRGVLGTDVSVTVDARGFGPAARRAATLLADAGFAVVPDDGPTRSRPARA